MLKITNWSKSYKDNQVLQNINFEIKTGDVLSIIGSSGSGKSTLLRSINFLEPADKGIIQFDNEEFDVETITKKDILSIRKKTAMVFQNYALFSRKTALENVTEALTQVQKMSNSEAKRQAEKFLKLVGMEERMDYYPSQLSGGQQQRVGIARALAIEPDVILFDEPTSALDPEMVSGILDLIQQIAHQKTTLILVTHEMKFAKQVSDQVLFIDQGTILESGSADEIFNHPKHERTKQFINVFN
ncbi:amino acid ABC transporter ATP-binding protein [Vagococcus silagei]|uniref:Amino acid ABC transporter ATP-binding protein n=1 Tax=Vagococcus silagei TaxID=2508885 RepID=A0A4V3TUV7_9ENTE|nr:amino acid ABC transporter ATP-binding protein [Vagococcus silagei]THB60409.1 amino acid ABC transporter ATP-binding protein [Vagococcus silagei]